MNHTCVTEDPFRSCGFTRINVRSNTEVSLKFQICHKAVFICLKVYYLMKVKRKNENRKYPSGRKQNIAAI